MRFKFLIDKSEKYSGWTVDSSVYINCANTSTHSELIDTITHEVFHAVMNVLKLKTTEKQDHYILPLLEPEWFI